MIYHNFREFNIQESNEYGFINLGDIWSFQNNLYQARRTFVPIGIFTQQQLIDYGYTEFCNPDEDSSKWIEIQKDCNNCLNMVITVDAEGNEYSYCPYMKNHLNECSEMSPTICQAYDMITKPILPVTLVGRKQMPIAEKIRRGIATKEEINENVARLLEYFDAIRSGKK